MRKILTSLALVATSLAFAQVSIAPGEVTPKATLDIKAIGGNTADGILIPRVSRDRAWRMENIEESTLIYVEQINGAKSGKTSDIDVEGFYYFKGGKWVKLGGGASSGAGTDTSIYNTDGTLNGNRELSLNGNKLTLGTGSASGNDEVVINSKYRIRGAVYVGDPDSAVNGTSQNFRVHSDETPIVYTPNDYMIIVTNKDISKKLALPDARGNKGRIIHLINGHTGGLQFKTDDDANHYTPFNFSILNSRSSCDFISDGNKWYPLGR